MEEDGHKQNIFMCKGIARLVCESGDECCLEYQRVQFETTIERKSMNYHALSVCHLAQKEIGNEIGICDTFG